MKNKNYKKRISVVFLSFSIICFVMSFIDVNYIPLHSQIISDYYPNSNALFEKNIIKTKKDEKVVIKIKNGEENKTKFKISDSSKIKIISSSYKGCIIERIKDFQGEEKLTVFNNDYQELSDICYISCYNELLNCKNIFIYKVGLNDSNNNTEISLGDGEYFIEFELETINSNMECEEESKIEIRKNLEDFFSSSIEETKARYYDLAYKINVNTQKIFMFEKRKTMSFKVDRAYFICSFIKAF